ncbi:lasso peptide biosynthesis B2 protein [Nocardiopsis sp. CT-R113]|uniref:Lasso peptide biosynthesis B2 protein n=1 Tax=Nocardiopsis codii TaxID=3065942 RepID=A0ABU7K939_9ACTN|nr:lasso peptide biosynthesis B2 protein [Nocardiopsis sp. CT-R113]MEE2038763.1 lasso peptide biosynthesis B2 protein [Nocardiopsis sp. CT-R113]
MTLPPSLSPAPHLRLVCFPSACVALDAEKGSVLLLSEEAGLVLTQLRGTGGATSSLSPCPAQKRALVALMDAGVLIRGEEARAWARVRPGVASSPNWGTRDSPAALAPIPRVPLRWYALGALALLLVLGCGLRGRGGAFARTGRLARRRSAGTADHAAATRVAYSVRRVGRLLPFRVACWEEAASTAVALRWAGCRADFRHGVATDPVRLHAWVEVGGRPVAESDDITDYTPFEEPDE